MKLCDLNTSKALQELGYDGEYQHCYVNVSDDGYETLTIAECKEYESDIDNQCPAPRLDDAAYFLREKHGIIAVAEYQSPFGCWNPYTRDTTSSEMGLCGYAKSCDKYEDALEFALKKAIQIIKDRQQ